MKCSNLSPIFIVLFLLIGFSLVVQTVKNPLARQETQIQSLGPEDPLKKGMATNSSSLAWRIPWTEEPEGLHGVTKSQTRWETKHTLLLSCITLLYILDTFLDIYFAFHSFLLASPPPPLVLLRYN